MKKILTLLVMSLSVQVQAAKADEFIVSGLLRSNGDGVVIKLVQGMKPASSANEAVGAFTREALAQYPGYSLVDAIASPLVKKVQPCRSTERAI